MNNFTERKPFVSYLSNNEIRFAEKFAARHDLEFIKPRNLRISKTHKQVIWASSESLLLQDLSIKNSKPFMIDYLSFKKIKAKSSLLKKCFSKKDSGRKVLDLTAGFCIDALEISYLGYLVTAIEKKSWLYDFTSHCLKNVDEKELKNSINRIDFVVGDSLDLIDNYSDHEIVYLDQMFDQKTDARAKREIQFLRNLDFGEYDLTRFAKSLKKNNFKKIIYKSALHSNVENLINLKPSRVIKGKSFKYNIFTMK
tara:strand:- start:3455 stop:4216 length:762 start_codon:yes stop_codon:yes gene_type:complete